MTDALSQEEIDSLLNNLDSDVSSSLQSRPLVPVGKKIKVYDFKRPDKFSKEQLRTVQLLHETFCRATTTNLSAQLRTLVQIHVVSADQLTYEEFIRSIPQSTTLSVIQMEPLRGNAILEIDPNVTFSIIDRLFGGRGDPVKVTRELTDIEASVMEGIVVKILTNMREAWSQVIDLRPRLSQIETNAQFAQIVPPNEMVILVTLEAKIGDVEGMMNFCIPYMTLEPIISRLSAQFWYSSSRKNGSRESLLAIKEKISNVSIDVITQIGKIDLTLREVLSMKVGSIIRLPNVTSTTPLTVKVGDKNKFLGKPGLVGKKIAVQIIKELDVDIMGDIEEEDDDEDSDIE